MRVLVVTAVPAERDAVTRAFGDVPETSVHHVPGAEIHRAGLFDVLAGGAGLAAAAASAAFGLASDRYDLVISAGIGGGFAGVAPVGSLVVADHIGAADLGAETGTGFVPVTELGFGRVRHFPPRSLVRATAAATGAVTGGILTVSTVTGSAERAAELLAAHPRPPPRPWRASVSRRPPSASVCPSWRSGRSRTPWARATGTPGASATRWPR